MCVKIVINFGEKEIETPQEFLEHFGFEAPKEENYDNVIMDSCLCQVDIDLGLNQNNIPFEIGKDGDYYVKQ